ncbi:uncharacterized protein [Magallana gigas]|uniref:uncharacterized protein isoform X2 n=1 Tax=Magallana gigas TaxID=29159 RepID=UPI00334178DB
MDFHFSFCVFYWTFFVFCLMRCGPLNQENEMVTPSTKNIPVSEQKLLRNFMDALDRLDHDKYSDISFHSIENVNGEYEFDISELLADHDVTGVDLIWTPSIYNSCRFLWAGNDIRLHGRRINSFVFFDFNHLFAMERSSKLIKIRLLPTPNCPLQNKPTNSFLVIYRNLSKGPVLQKLQELRISRIKRDSKSLQPLGTKYINKLKREVKSNTKDPGCHLVPWTVDFIRLQWDTFIVAPVIYEANACQRTRAQCKQTETYCLHSRSKKPSNYEVLRHIYSTQLGVSPPGNSSCKPSKYGSLTMMLYDRDRDLYEIRIVPNMRVLECECSTCSLG